jgi:hypothetical protein
MMITLSKAAQQLTNKTGTDHSVDDLICLIRDSVHMKDGDARRLPGFAIAPRGAFDSVKLITRVPDDVDIFGETICILGDSVFQLSWIHAHGLVLEGSSQVSRFCTGDFEWWANKSFMIYLENVRVRKSDVELLADAVNDGQVIGDRATNANESSQPDGEPPMNGEARNARAACFAWVQYMEPTMRKEGESLKTLCQRIIDEANGPLRRYRMANNEPFSIHIAESALKPSAMGRKGKPGITGGIKANPGAGRKKAGRE